MAASSAKVSATPAHENASQSQVLLALDVFRSNPSRVELGILGEVVDLEEHANVRSQRGQLYSHHPRRRSQQVRNMFIQHYSSCMPETGQS